jgi:hypothetical protein
VVEPVAADESVADDSLPPDSLESLNSLLTDGDEVAADSEGKLSLRSGSEATGAAEVVATLGSASAATPLAEAASSLPFRPRLTFRPRVGVGRARWNEGRRNEARAVVAGATVVTVPGEEVLPDVKPPCETFCTLVVVDDSVEADPRVRGTNPRRTAPIFLVVTAAAEAGVVDCEAVGVDLGGAELDVDSLPLVSSSFRRRVDKNPRRAGTLRAEAGVVDVGLADRLRDERVEVEVVYGALVLVDDET